MKTIQDINFKNKKALIRVDFNVPLNKDLVVTDTTRIEAAKTTILKILKDGGSCVLLSHLGRPKNKELEFSLQHIIEAASRVLGVPVLFAPDCVGDTAQTAVARLKPSEVLLLENVRYYKEETAGDPDFAKKLSKLGDIYVNDAFGSAHRAHASTAVITENFPERQMLWRATRLRNKKPRKGVRRQQKTGYRSYWRGKSVLKNNGNREYFR